MSASGNFSASKSSNIAQPIDPDGGDPSRTFWKAVDYDANVFADVTPAMRLALSCQHIGQTFVANEGKTRTSASSYPACTSSRGTPS